MALKRWENHREKGLILFVTQRLERLKRVFRDDSLHTWLYHGKTSWLHVLWFVLLLGALAWLDGPTHFVWLVPPFAATLSILLLLPASPIAQPFPVVLGPTIGACVGTAAALVVHGPIYAVLIAGLMLWVLPLLKVYHPPGVALSMYPLMLHTSVWFPLVVVLPFTVAAVATSSLLSRVSKAWPDYPVPLKR